MDEFGLERIRVEDIIVSQVFADSQTRTDRQFCFLYQNEIFDMVKPKDPCRITLQDLIASGVGDTVVTILTDVNGFWAYDNRENLVQEQDN